jgi:hypothetical protein
MSLLIGCLKVTFVVMRIGILLIVSLLSLNEIKAQDRPYFHHNERLRLDSQSNTLQGFLRKGSFFGHARFFSMATDNSEGLTDYFAHSIGIGIGYETGKWNNFTLGISGYAIYNLHSSDFTKLDSSSNQPNRYELGLFDVTNPSNHHDLDRLEDLYVKYSNSKIDIKFGKQHIRSPFINPQDGRMRPTLIQGLIIDYQLSSKVLIHLANIQKISPRSTIAWYDVAESIGIYGQGVNVNGTKSNYAGQLPKSEIFYVGAEIKVVKSGMFQVWNQTVTNIFNSTLFQFENSISLNKSNNFHYGLQFIRQDAINDGGNSDVTKTYFTKNAKSNVFGLRVGVSQGKAWKFTLNYTRITKDSRYLMPREWGRDPFFTFMPRERNEGYGDLNAFTAVLSKNLGTDGLRLDLSYGRFYLPEISNPTLNKYGFPSYEQLNIDLRYSFKGFLKGFDIQGLYVLKNALSKDQFLPKYEINKVNLNHYNLILNYHF